MPVTQFCAGSKFFTSSGPSAAPVPVPSSLLFSFSVSFSCSFSVSTIHCLINVELSLCVLSHSASAWSRLASVAEMTSMRKVRSAGRACFFRCAATFWICVSDCEFKGCVNEADKMM